MEDWKFDKSVKPNIYSVGMNMIETRHFKKIDVEDTLTDNVDKDTRKAGIIQKLMRNEARKLLQLNSSYKDIVDRLEQKANELCNSEKDCGLAFPININVNNVIAHDGPLLQDSRTLSDGDVVKISLGIHLNGNIVDASFTHVVSIDESKNIYNDLLEASRDSLYSAISICGPDARLIEISEVISEVINSYELPVDTDFETLKISPVKGVGGYNILPYRMNGTKFILCEPDTELQGDSKMEEGEVYAISTISTTGKGDFKQDTDLDKCYKFMINPSVKNKRFVKKNCVYKQVAHRNDLPFSLSWCDTFIKHKKSSDVKKFRKDLLCGIRMQDILAFAPLRDEADSKVAEFCHTVRIRDSAVEIYSKGDDY